MTSGARRDPLRDGDSPTNGERGTTPADSAGVVLRLWDGYPSCFICCSTGAHTFQSPDSFRK